MGSVFPPGTIKWYMRSRRGLALLFLQIFTFLFGRSGSVWSDDEKLKKELLRQQEKLNRETSPVGKAKVLVKISDLHLQSAAHAVKTDFREADNFLVQYTESVNQALGVLKSSGRNAQKNPAGFKQFEISLRKQLRLLDDLKSQYPYDRVGTIDRAIQVAKSAQEEMFEEIFGVENTNPGKQKEKESASQKEKK
jgi:hypothetical protein